MERPLLKFSCFVNGREAEVSVCEDRIEWTGIAPERSPGSEPVGRRAARLARTESGCLRFGTLSSVTMWRASSRRAVVGVAAAGIAVEFRVAHEEAARLADELNRGMLAAAMDAPDRAVLPRQTQAAQAADQIRTLGMLYAAGLLSDDQFNAERNELLAEA